MEEMPILEPRIQLRVIALQVVPISLFTDHKETLTVFVACATSVRCEYSGRSLKWNHDTAEKAHCPSSKGP